MVVKGRNSIAKNIRKIRKDKELSQDYVASKLNISQQAYQKIENGSTKIGIDHLTDLASILEVELIALIENNENDSTFTFTKEAVKETFHLIQYLKDEVEHFKEEVKHLRMHNNKLMDLLEDKKANNSD